MPKETNLYEQAFLGMSSKTLRLTPLEVSIISFSPTIKKQLLTQESRRQFSISVQNLFNISTFNVQLKKYSPIKLRFSYSHIICKVDMYMQIRVHNYPASQCLFGVLQLGRAQWRSWLPESMQRWELLKPISTSSKASSLLFSIYMYFLAMFLSQVYSYNTTFQEYKNISNCLSWNTTLFNPRNSQPFHEFVLELQPYTRAHTYLVVPLVQFIALSSLYNWFPSENSVELSIFVISTSMSMSLLMPDSFNDTQDQNWNPPVVQEYILTNLQLEPTSSDMPMTYNSEVSSEIRLSKATQFKFSP